MTELAHDTSSGAVDGRLASDTKPAVLLVVPWDQESGGVASVVGYLGRHLQHRGHAVLFLHPGASETVRYRKTRWGFDGVELNLRAPFLHDHPVRSVIAFLLALPFTFLQLLQLLQKHNIRVVNIHYPGSAFVYFALCRWILPIRLVVSVHGTDVLPVDPPGKRRSSALALLLRAADLVVGPSRGFLHGCGHVLTHLRRPSIAIHNGIDIAELESEAAQGTETTESFILSAASHDHWKGLDVLIRAFGVLRDEGETARLVLAGDGPIRHQLEILTADLGLQQQVLFIGYQSRRSLARLLNDSAVFVLPSRSEPFGIAIIEALACGKPVVATAVGGIPEIIDNDVNGILVDPDDPPALAAAIRRLLGDAALRERLGRAGRIRVKDHFQWQTMGESYARAYEDLLQRGT